MPTSNPTGYEGYVYIHTAPFTINRDPQPHKTPSFYTNKLPTANSDEDEGPLVMVEPTYTTIRPNDVFIRFKGGFSVFLSRASAEQLRDALIRVCEKPIEDE